MTNKEWVDLAVAACEHAGAEYATLEIVATWDKRYCSNAVYRLDDDRYLKIFGPTSKRQLIL